MSCEISSIQKPIIPHDEDALIQEPVCSFANLPSEVVLNIMSIVSSIPKKYIFKTFSNQYPDEKIGSCRGNELSIPSAYGFFANNIVHPFDAYKLKTLYVPNEQCFVYRDAPNILLKVSNYEENNEKHEMLLHNESTNETIICSREKSDMNKIIEKIEGRNCEMSRID